MIRRYPYTLLLLHAVLWVACLLVTVFCSPLKGTPQWVVTLAFLNVVAVIPLSALHVVLGSGDGR